MKIYTLEFVSRSDGRAERLWHTNRRALERYAQLLSRSDFRVTALRTLELSEPLSPARMLSFLNTHCAELPSPAPVDGRCPMPGRADGPRHRTRDEHSE